MMSEEKKEMLQMVRMALLFLTVMALVWAIMILVKNKDIIQKDPLIYGMDVHNFSSCQCIDYAGKDWYSTDGGFLHEERSAAWIDYGSDEYKLNVSKIKVNNGTG